MAKRYGAKSPIARRPSYVIFRVVTGTVILAHLMLERRIRNTEANFVHGSSYYGIVPLLSYLYDETLYCCRMGAMVGCLH